MADEKVQRTDTLDLGPGVVITPGYDVPQPVTGVTFSDRVLHADNSVNPHPIASIVDGDAPVHPPDEDKPHEGKQTPAAAK